MRAFADGWKSVEVVQAFMCLTYWKEPEEERTWMFVGYAARMAVELGLSQFVGKNTLEGETEVQMRERRNRERTYLVLFVHDRSLSTQTGRQWMLPECELVRRSKTWHTEGPSTPAPPADVIVAAFVQLQRIASEGTAWFREVKEREEGAGGGGGDTEDGGGGGGAVAAGGSGGGVNYDKLLSSCNGKLAQWMDTWQHEMRKAGGETFHFSFLNFFRLLVRLFLNSFGVHGALASSSSVSPSPCSSSSPTTITTAHHPTHASHPSVHPHPPSPQALSACYESAMDMLTIADKDLADMGMLQYSQDSITVMTAYAAIFLLRLLRNEATLAELHDGAREEIYERIGSVAGRYGREGVRDIREGRENKERREGGMGVFAHHARFLRGLVEADRWRVARAAMGASGGGSGAGTGRKQQQQVDVSVFSLCFLSF